MSPSEDLLVDASGKRGSDTDIVLPSMIFDEPLAPLASAELCDLCICLETMADIVRIPRGHYPRGGWAFCVRIRVTF